MLGRGGGVRGTWAWWMGLGIVSGVINQLCRSVERQEVEKLKNSTLFWLKKLEVFWVFFMFFPEEAAGGHGNTFVHTCQQSRCYAYIRNSNQYIIRQILGRLKSINNSICGFCRTNVMWII